MDGEVLATDKRNGENVACVTKISSSCSLHHKRSKSASDRNLDIARNGTSYCMGKDCNESKNLLDIVRSSRAQGSVEQVSSDNNSNASLDPQASLEDDLCVYFWKHGGMQSHAIDTSESLSIKDKRHIYYHPDLSPLGHLTCSSCTFEVGHMASNQHQIKQLQMHLHQEKSIRLMLEKAIGRASSTLSPGHRHFATQTRELISEIDLLEEEIANREQHVLSLYRSIFDQCVSGPSSAQSSGMASPAHSKNGVRKHPGIISSAFCSSKKFPLKSFNILASVKESVKSNLLIKRKVKNETPLSGITNFHVESNFSDPMKKLPTAGRSYLARTLNKHLYQCPSKLSEELVRCMAAIYSLVRREASANPERAHSPFLSRSSTSVILPRRGAGDQQEWSCRSMVEISSISMDKNHFSSASYAISNYRLLVEQLERVDTSALESNVKLTFWVNVYNSLVMHAYLAYGIPHSSLRRMALFHKAAYNIGGHTITANSIENFILCCRTPRIGRWFETILSTAMRKKYGEEKQLIDSNFGVLTSQPLVLFALCSGAVSDPLLRVYTAKNVIEELGKAKKEFLQANVVVKKSRKVFLPKILERYAKEVSLTCDDLLTWVSENVDKKVHEAIQNCIDSKNKRKASQIIEWLPYNTRFRYVFGKDLTEKPWWA